MTFSFVDVTGTSGMDEWIRGDSFFQTRVGNKTNPLVENVDVTVQEAYDDELGFSEVSFHIWVNKTPKLYSVLQYALVNNNDYNN